MTHFSASKEASRATPREWLACGAQVGELVNEWSRRSDLVVLMGPDAGSGSPACFKPEIAEIEVNTAAAFGESIKPKHVGDLTQRVNQFEWPAGTGAILHEAMHSRHSLWSLPKLAEHPDARVQMLVTLFEESRIEARGIAHYPANRSFLRACAMSIVVQDMDEEKLEELKASPAMGISHMILLSLARVDAGVLEPGDVSGIRDAAAEAFGEELLEELRQLWIHAQAHDEDRSFAPLVRLAERWIELLEEAGHSTTPEPGEPGEPGEGGAPGGMTIPGPLAEILEEMIEGLPELAEEIEIDAITEGYDKAEEERRERIARANEKLVRERTEHKKKAEEVFGRGTGPAPYASTSSRLVEKRKPTAKERAAAVTIARMLDKARYRDRQVTTRSSIAPPGRLKGRIAVQAAAERSRGVVVTAEPWNRKQRRTVEDPKLTMGVLVDISGSMSSAMQPMATTAWVFSEAARRIQANVAMVYYGDSVFATLKPGQHLDNVEVYTAPDSTEYFEPAFKALDGAIGLLSGTGARLLVIVSDFVYTGQQLAYAKERIARCTREGIAVVVIPFAGARYTEYRKFLPKAGATVLEGVEDSTEAAVAIGKAAADALTKAGTAVR